MRVELHPEALLELEAAVSWYEEQGPGMGERFIESVDDAFARAAEAPFAWPILEEDIRRVLTRVFPYAILYTPEPDRIHVIAVMHCHRKPGYWRNRI